VTCPTPSTPAASQPPLSEAEMRSMWRGGDSLAQIASKALRRNRIGKAKVREIVFGETDAALEAASKGART